MIEGAVGKQMLLEQVLADGNPSMFTVAVLYDSSGFVAAVVNLASIENGLYQGMWTPSAAGQFSAVFRVFEDSARTILATQYEFASEFIRIRSHDFDEAVRDILAHNGENVRDDVLSYDSNGRPLTLRRRIFPNAATASASTPGGTGEGETATITASAQHIDAARWETLLRVRS